MIKNAVHFISEKHTFSYSTKWDIRQTDRICILSPHPDDETIGCGGLLFLYAKQCDVICLTDGRYGDPKIEPSKMAQIRKKEFETVMKKIGVNKYTMLGLEDSKLSQNAKDFHKLDLRNYDYILIPGPNDSHPDHLAVDKMLRKAMYGNAKIVYYEIWNTLANQTHYLDISKVVNKKRALINLYKSQVKHIDYADRILSLNHYRGICHAVDFEEAYEFKK